MEAQAVKAARFGYRPTRQVLGLLETFRSMVNDALYIGFEQRPRSRFALIAQAYAYLKERYGLHTHYILSACECAFAMLRNRRWRKLPRVRKLFLKLDNQTYRLDYMLLRIPKRPREFCFIQLEGGEYQLSFLRNPKLKRGSLTMTERHVTIAFTKESEPRESRDAVALDINERSIVLSDGKRHGLSKIAALRERYAKIRKSIQRRVHRDSRLSKKLLSKYGYAERERVRQALHVITKRIVERAKGSGSAIVLERLTYLRRKHARGNGKSRRLRARLNRWCFREIQRQIEYKARWEGIR